MPFNFSKEVDDYINKQVVEKQAQLSIVRDLFIKTIPNCTEMIAWNMPSYKLKKYVIHFAAHKNHFGIYPGPNAIEYYKKDLEKYNYTKGAIQFTYNEKLPIALLKKIIKYNVQMQAE